MASPFAIFRKNQRVWMAMAVFIAIVAFVISPAIESVNNSRIRGNGDNPVMASWNGGSIDRDQMWREFYELRSANTFLAKLAKDVRAKGGTPNVPGVSPDLTQLGITSYMEPPERILERKLLVAEASRRGIVFNDESVKTFLKRFVDGKLDGQHIEKTLKESTGGQLTWFDFNRLMCEEMAKHAVLQLGSAGVRYEERRDSIVRARPPLSTPGKNWQDFLRFNQAAKIQAFPIFVRDFESQVQGKPTEREIQALYQDGKDIPRMARTIATQPAFMRTKKAEFEYVSIDVEKLVTQQMALIPEDTLRAEYDRRVADKQFRVPVSPETTNVVFPEGSSESKPNTPPVLPDPSNPPTSEQTVAPESKPESKPDKEPETEPAPQPAAQQESKSNEIPQLPLELKPAVPTEKPTAQRLDRNSGIQLVSFQSEKEQSTTTEPKPTEPNTTAAPPAATQPAATQPAATQPAATQPASIELSDAKPPELAPSTPQSSDTAVAEATPMRTKTFEEVKDQIARDLARGTSIGVVNERINRIMEPMNIYKANLRSYLDRVAAKDKMAEVPARPDLKELAKTEGFEYGTTGMIDTDSAVLSPIGSSFVMPSREQQPFQFAALINVSTELGETFTPLMSMGFQGGNQQFVFWKVGEIQPVTPSVDSVRDQIEEVWKKQQALKLAETRARELASKIGTSPFADSFASPEEKALINEPANFTWYNPMFARMESRMQLSTVELLRQVDNSFMEAVFACKSGDTTFASDVDKTVVYVVKVVELSPETNSLLEKFAAAPLEGVATVARMESDRAIQPWFQNIQKQLGFRSRME
ncbi:MAG: hypothetical protein ABL921_06520 [Pirellula sp.]